MTTPGPAPERPVFEPRDDQFHFDELGDDWWATETSWFSFHHPQRRLGGWLYTMARPTIGTVAGGVWVWDDTASLPWEVPYSVNYSALRLPPDTDLSDVVLPTGVAIRVEEPGQVYELGYSDGDRLVLSLRFAGVMLPEPLTAVGSTFGNAHHFDQFGRVTGHIVLHGERIDIDCVAIARPHMGAATGGPAPAGGVRHGAASATDGFLAVTDRRDDIAYGFLRRDGRTVPLEQGHRRVERSAEHGWITTIEIEGTDADGRRLRAAGEPVSRMIVNRHTFIDINSLVRWELDGQAAWGEDQDMWPMHEWSARQRDGRGASP